MREQVSGHRGMRNTTGQSNQAAQRRPTTHLGVQSTSVEWVIVVDATE